MQVREVLCYTKTKDSFGIFEKFPTLFFLLSGKGADSAAGSLLCVK